MGRLPDWEALLSSAARLQSVVPGAVVFGGSAAALLVGHRRSMDHDHVVSDLRARFDETLSDLESVAGWRTARMRPPVLVLGSLDGIQTGVRQLIRKAPLETREVDVGGVKLTVPTEAETLRIKGVLILKRNAVRDYLDFAALADWMGGEAAEAALGHFDELYPQDSGESALQQLLAQLADPSPYDLAEIDLAEYKGLVERWRAWDEVRRACAAAATDVMLRLTVKAQGLDADEADDGGPGGR